jgi:RHS repeat-associated protein
MVSKPEGKNSRNYMMCAEKDQLNHISDFPQMPSFSAGNNLGEEGLYYFNARWYDPQLGRFITEDPIKDGLNWFAYVSNNPLRYRLMTVVSGEETSGYLWETNSNMIA